MELEEKELSMRHSKRRLSNSQYLMESGRAGSRRARSSSSALPAPARSPSRSPSPPLSPQGAPITNVLSGLNNLCSLLLSPAWVQTFVMTFLGEWGDRSQIATIAMAAGQDYWWVTAGAVFGHSLCTAGAVIGGRAIAGKVSMRIGMLSCSYLSWSSGTNLCSSHSRRFHCFLGVWGHILGRIFIFSLWVETAFFSGMKWTYFISGPCEFTMYNSEWFHRARRSETWKGKDPFQRSY